MKKQTKRLLATSSLLTLTGIATYVGHYFYNYAISTKSNKEAIVGKRDLNKFEERKKGFEAKPCDHFYVKSSDHLKLHGFYYPGTTHTWIITLHGYGGTCYSNASLASDLNQQGYHVLMPDLRGHGLSEGAYVGMGYLERDDVKTWINFILNRDSQAKIVLHGVSMGAASVMLTLKEKLPNNVIACVEDCGYTHAMDLFKHQIHTRYRFPMAWAIHCANLTTKLKAGYFFQQANPLMAIKHTTVPILFIHGNKDDFVPYAMVHRLYDACASDKELYSVQDAKHVECYSKDKVTYVNTFIAFIKKHGSD